MTSSYAVLVRKGKSSEYDLPKEITFDLEKYIFLYTPDNCQYICVSGTENPVTNFIVEVE